MPYSTIRGNYSRGRVDKVINNIAYFNRDEIKFINLELYNKVAQKEYKDILELITNPPSFEDELKIRDKLINNPYDLSAIFVLDELITSKLDIYLESKTYEDMKEVLIDL